MGFDGRESEGFFFFFFLGRCSVLSFRTRGRGVRTLLDCFCRVCERRGFVVWRFSFEREIERERWDR